MSTEGVRLHGFAYGEHLEGLSQRSLGFRLLAPVEPAAWCTEVEALAHRLQAAPYPDHWPACDLFCSVLLGDGQRLVALARYGLFDHTSSPRRGGLELIGLVGPAALDVPSALGIYHWLKKRRDETDDLRTLGGTHELAQVLAASPPQPPHADPTPVLPVRLWQEGALLFAATTPSDPDHRLNLLEQGTGTAWQWLPLVGAAFPLATYAQRGPLVAWTPHLSDVAVKLDRRGPDSRPLPPPAPWPVAAAAVALLVLLVGLAAANLWQTAALRRETAALRSPNAARAEPAAPREPAPNPDAAQEAREQFANALADLLERSGPREWSRLEPQLLALYLQVVRDPRYRDLRLKETNARGKAAVGAAVLYGQRNAERLRETVEKALTANKLDPKLVKVIGESVYQQLNDELKDAP